MRGDIDDRRTLRGWGRLPPGHLFRVFFREPTLVGPFMNYRFHRNMVEMAATRRLWSLPLPRVNEHPMKFRVVPNEGMFAEGVYAVAVEWQDPIFQRPLRRVEPGEERRERTILIESPDSLLGESLEEARTAFPLRHGACYTCYQYGAICSNPSSGGQGSKPIV